MAKPTYDIVLGPHKHVEAIKSGEIASPNFDLNFIHYETTHDSFKAMVREQRFQIAEMAIVTFMLAKAWGKPLVMLPAVMVGRFQHPFASVNAGVGMTGPGDLAGKRIGLRSPTVTTVTWQLGMLRNDYGADTTGAEWISYEDAHVAEYSDATTRAPEGKTITRMLEDGEIDVALGDPPKSPRAKPLWPDAEAEAKRWYDKHKVVPINHVVCVTEEMMEKNFDHVVEFYRMLKKNKERVPHPGPGPDPTPVGFEAMRASAELIVSYVVQQKMAPRDLTVDDLLDPRIMKAIGE